MSFSVRPATRFADVAAILGPRNPQATVCWCLSHRLAAKTNKALVGPVRGAYVEELTRRDVAPGVLAYDDGDEGGGVGCDEDGGGVVAGGVGGVGGAGGVGEVVGWAGVAPRAELPFARSRTIPHVDDLPVWSVWCFRVRAGHRGRGVAHALLEGAVAFAREHGAPAVEGYPVDNRGEKVDLTMAYVGTRRLFESAGFTVAAATSSVSGGFPRVLMRRSLSG